jgi:hypothetical protein
MKACIFTDVSGIVLPYHQSAVKTEAARSSEITVNIHHTTRRHIPEDIILHSHCPRASDLAMENYFTQ